MPWAPDYATTAELKAFLRIPALDTEDDTHLAAALTASSRAIDFQAGRQFGNVAAPEARLFEVVGHGSSRWPLFVSIDDLYDTTGLTIRYSTVAEPPVYDQAVTEYRLWPFNAADNGRPYERLLHVAGVPVGHWRVVEITALWGWAAVPGTIKAATLLQASRFFARRNAPFGVAGSPDMGSEVRLLSKVDPDVAVMVRPYARQWGAV